MSSSFSAYGGTTKGSIRVANDILVLTRTWPFGLYRIDSNEDSLLFRPYRQIATTGAPTGTLNYAVLQTDESLPKPDAGGFWGERLLDTMSPWRRHPIPSDDPAAARIVLLYAGEDDSLLSGIPRHVPDGVRQAASASRLTQKIDPSTGCETTFPGSSR